MKSYKFSIRGNEYDVNIIGIEDNIAEIEVNGTKYNVELHKEFKTVKTPKLVRSQVVHSGDTDKAKTRKPDDKKGPGMVKAPLPGTILEIKVKEGTEVKSGDILLIMEAMKMENEIRSDKNGKVQSVKVNVSDSVLEGDVLVEIGE